MVLGKSRSRDDVEQWLSYVISELRLADLLENSEQYPDEIANLKLLLNEAAVHNLKGTKLTRFANLGTPDDEVTVTTRHSAKGLEFEAVIMIGMEESKFPNYYSLKSETLLAESQRLCYVSVSRAKNCCILVRSKYYFEWDKPKQYAPSRFWVALHNKFGNENNSFSAEEFGKT